MTLMLCRHCFAWSEPLENWCAGCHLPLNADEPDPDLHVIEAVLGELRQEIAEVRLCRRQLPELGTLFLTTGGLLFLPHRTRPVLDRDELLADPLVPAKAAGSAPATSFFGRLVTFSGSWLSREREGVANGELCFDLRRTPAELLMDDPGVFFVARDSIQKVRLSGRACWIDRVRGAAVKLQPIDRTGASSFALGRLVAEAVATSTDDSRIQRPYHAYQ